MPGYIAVVGGVTGWLEETEENLNGTEICKINLVNTSANRTLVNTDGTGTATLRWMAGPTLFTGTYTGAKHAKDVLCVPIIPSVYYKMAYKEYTGEFTEANISTILTAVGTAAGVNVSYLAGVDPEISVRFVRASCLDIGNFIADLANSDRYSDHTTNTFIIGPRGSNKGAIEVIADAETERVKDKKGKVNIVYVRGNDSLGAYIEGSYDDGLGTKVRSYTEKKASSESTLDKLAKKYYDDLNTEDGPSTISVRLDQAQNILLGDTVTLTEPELSLSGSYRISKIVRRLDSCQIGITVPNKSLEQKILDLKKYEDFGIYVMAGVVKTMQNWSSDIIITAVDWDTATWTSGTIKFADDTTQAIDSGTTGNLGSPGIYFLYFTISETTLRATADYDTAVSSTTAIFAKLTVSSNTDQLIAIDAPNVTTQSTINDTFIPDDTIVSAAMRKGLQPYNSNIKFYPLDASPHDTLVWDDGATPTPGDPTITFSGGSSWAINADSSDLFIPGTFYWVYFTVNSHDLVITDDYSDCISDVSGLLAKVYVSTDTLQDIQIVVYRGKGENFTVDQLGANSVDTIALTADAIYGKDFATAILVGQSNPGIRILGEAAQVVVNEVHMSDDFGEHDFEAGIWGWDEVDGDLVRKFWMDYLTGIIRIYGSGGLVIAASGDNGGADIGELGTGDIADTLSLWSYGGNVEMSVGGRYFRLQSDLDIITDPLITMNFADSKALILPIRSSDGTPRDGEIWMLDT